MAFTLLNAFSDTPVPPSLPSFTRTGLLQFWRGLVHCWNPGSIRPPDTSSVRDALAPYQQSIDLNVLLKCLLIQSPSEFEPLVYGPCQVNHIHKATAAPMTRNAAQVAKRTRFTVPIFFQNRRIFDISFARSLSARSSTRATAIDSAAKIISPPARTMVPGPGNGSATTPSTDMTMPTVIIPCLRPAREAPCLAFRRL